MKLRKRYVLKPVSAFKDSNPCRNHEIRPEDYVRQAEPQKPPTQDLQGSESAEDILDG